MGSIANIYCASYDVESYLHSKQRTKNKNNHGTDYGHLLNDQDKQQILDFCTAKTAEGMKPARVYKYAKILVSWMQFFGGKHWNELALADTRKAVATLERSTYADTSRVSFKAIMKVFFRWMKGCPEYRNPEETEWLKCNVPKPKRYSSKEMLNDADVSKLMNATADTELRAFVSLLFDSGTRIGEILALRLKDVTLEDDGAIIHVPDDAGCKTGSRDIYIVASVGYIAQWMNAHPAKDDPNAFLFCGKQATACMSYNTTKVRIDRLAKKAGLQKRHNCHFFRKSRATALAKAGWSQAQLNSYFGWTISSDMASTYIMMTSRDTKEPMLRLYGIVPKEKAVSYTKNLNCEYCKTINPPGSTNCSGCGSPIDGREKTMQNAELKRLEQLLGMLKSKQTTQE